jgi:hypothetical protein
MRRKNPEKQLDNKNLEKVVMQKLLHHGSIDGGTRYDEEQANNIPTHVERERVYEIVQVWERGFAEFHHIDVV